MTDEIYRTCCFTGHRESKLPWLQNENDARCVFLKRRIFDVVEAVYADGIRHYICGMANGCDLYFLEAVLAFRSSHSDVSFETVITRCWSSATAKPSCSRRIPAAA